MTKTHGPYSTFQSTGNFIYTAGHVGVKEGRAASDIISQARQALNNLSETLSEAGVSINHVVKTTVYLKDMAHFAEMNEVYAEFFSGVGRSPARTTVGVSELPRIADNPLLIEIEAVAYAR